jgi:hypothetical protein
MEKCKTHMLNNTDRHRQTHIKMYTRIEKHARMIIYKMIEHGYFPHMAWGTTPCVEGWKRRQGVTPHLLWGKLAMFYIHHPTSHR